MHALDIILTKVIADWIMVGIMALVCIALIVAILALIKTVFYDD